MRHGAKLAEDLHYLSLGEIGDEILNKRISAEALVSQTLERIARLEPRLKSFSHLLPDTALCEARQADREIGSGLCRGPLHGVPIGIKDIIDVKGVTTGCGMAHIGDRNAGEDATAVARLRDAGAVIIGKLQMTEGASLVHHPHCATPDNPWKTGYWAGVSSSGSGSATAAGLCFASLGTDTGGSIRMPAAACGLSGLKPTWGRVSRHGVHPLAASFDHVGPITRSVADLALVLRVIAGRDDKDMTSLSGALPDYGSGLGQGVRGLRVGVDRKQIRPLLDPAVEAVFEQSIETLSRLGATVIEIATPSARETSASVMPLVIAESASAYAMRPDFNLDHHGPHFRSMLEAGLAQSGMNVARALDARAEVRGAYRALFVAVDIILTPTLPCETPSQQCMTDIEDDLDALFEKITLFTFPANIAELPALTIPGGFGGNGLPIGIQMTGGELAEHRLLQIGIEFQRQTAFHRSHPRL